jgi:hypothetical protein
VISRVQVVDHLRADRRLREHELNRGREFFASCSMTAMKASHGAVGCALLLDLPS